MSVLDDFSDIVDEIVLDQIDKSDFEKTKSINKEIKKLTSLSYQKLLSYSKSLQKFENKIYQDINKYFDEINKEEKKALKKIYSLAEKIHQRKNKIQLIIKIENKGKFDDPRSLLGQFFETDNESYKRSFDEKVYNLYIDELINDSKLEDLLNDFNDYIEMLNNFYKNNKLDIDIRNYEDWDEVTKLDISYEDVITYNNHSGWGDTHSYNFAGKWWEKDDSSIKSWCLARGPNLNNQNKECPSYYYYDESNLREFFNYFKKILEKAKRRSKDREKTSKIAAFNKKARTGAQVIRSDLMRITPKKDWKCPYCSKKKSINLAEADHIHPVNKGGLSTMQNMVLVCKRCNQNKKSLTLRVFTKRSGFDFEKVCVRLEQLGKDV